TPHSSLSHSLPPLVTGPVRICCVERGRGRKPASGVRIMTLDTDEHERTMAFAEIALGQIKALRQPALRRHYEIWYNYATGYNPSLNQAINDMLSANGNLSATDVDNIYDTFLSPIRLTARIDSVGSKVMGEIEEIMSMIDAAVGSASR